MCLYTHNVCITCDLEVYDGWMTHCLVVGRHALSEKFEICSGREELGEVGITQDH